MCILEEKPYQIPSPGCQMQTDKFCQFKHRHSLFDCPSISKVKQMKLAAPVTHQHGADENMAVIIFIRAHPCHCFPAASGRRRAPTVRLRARCAAQNLLNKYMLFYGHFVPTMQTHFPLANGTARSCPTYHFMEICKLSNPVLFAGFKEKKKK